MKKLILALFMICLFTSMGWGAEGKKLSQFEEYDLSERCGQRAEAFYKAKNPEELPDRIYESEGVRRYYSYKNHYNKKMNKCFIRIDVNYSSLNSSEYPRAGVDLYDVNEHDRIASVFEVKDKKLFCNVLGTSCNSKAEWETLIKSYMEE